MRTRAKRKYVASDCARRENVPRHILFIPEPYTDRRHLQCIRSVAGTQKRQAKEILSKRKRKEEEEICEERNWQTRS